MKKNIQDKDIAIKISGVNKMYKLGQIGGGTLRADLESWWARIRGKEDPNSIIGQDQRLIGQTFMALHGIDLTIYKGEAIGIIGGNGAGKSTLLKLLSRVTAPTAGKIEIYGRIASMLEVGTGFSGEMTGRENVYMNGAILGMTKAEIDAKMEDIIEFSEVREFIDTPVKRYSSGMYVKLAFSVAAHLDAEIMIMDEVLAVGDMAFQKKCLDKMRDAAQQEGRTVLYVSHNMNTIRKLCSRCIVLNKGKLIFDGDVNKAISLYINAEYCEDVFMDLSRQPFPHFLPNPSIQFLSAKFANKESNAFVYGEPINLHLRWKALADVKGACIRIELVSMEDIPVATYMLNDIYSGPKGEISEATLQLDSTLLMEAKYRMRYVFFIRDSLGENVNIGYADGLSLSKLSENSPDPIIWDAQHWGFIRMPPPKVY